MDRIELRYNNEFIYCVEVLDEPVDGKSFKLLISPINAGMIKPEFTKSEILTLRLSVIQACELMIATIKEAIKNDAQNT